MITNGQMTIQDKTEMLQGKGYVLALPMDNGVTKNIRLVDKQNVYNNHLQVINQYEVTDGAYKNRYDVTILVNGLPMFHAPLFFAYLCTSFPAGSTRKNKQTKEKK